MLFSGPSVPSSQQETKDDDGQPHVAEAPEQYRSDKKRGADPEKSKSEKELVNGQIVDVAIVYESMKVVYDEGGSPVPADPTDADFWKTTGNPKYEGSGE